MNIYSLTKEGIVRSSKDLITKVIGTNGYNKLMEFIGYEPGWYWYNKGERLRKHSLFKFIEFAILIQHWDIRPRVFLELEGNITASWEDKHGQYIGIEFMEDEFEFYFEGIDYGDCKPYEHLEDIVNNHLYGLCIEGVTNHGY